MRKSCVSLLFCLALLLGPANLALAKDLYFPHFAEGAGWFFQLTLTNLSSQTAVGTITFYDSTGSPQILPFNSGMASSFELSIPVASAVTFATAGTSPTLLTGYAVVELDQENVTGILLFHYQNGTEVSVPPQLPGQRFFMLVESSAAMDSGVAVALKRSDQTLKLQLVDNRGQLKASRTWALRQRQGAKFLKELFGELGNFQGVLELTSMEDFACVGLRLSPLSLSAIPVFDPRMSLNIFPILAITTPTTNSTYAASTKLISLAGTAYSKSDIASVTYSTDRGSGGNAYFKLCNKNNWYIDNVTLQEGTNVVTVTAVDTLGYVTTGTLTVYYTLDTTAPKVGIIFPTANATYLTSGTQIAITGTASDDIGVTRVTYQSDRGPAGAATGTDSWVASPIVLFGNQNVITITAQDAAGNTGTDVITVWQSAGSTNDTAPPSISISSPTSNSTYSTSNAFLNLAGTASDDVGVTSVSWLNDRGGSGTAGGTTSWSVSGILLKEGVNIITVIASDTAGSNGTDNLTVTYSPPAR